MVRVSGDRKGHEGKPATAERVWPPELTKRLLVVDNDVELASGLERGLVLEGYRVDLARTGEQALSQANAHDYDAVVLDVVLPGMDGFSVCELLRGNERWMPVLMLTARADVSDRIKALDAGADDCLAKPFDFGELLARLRALSRRGRPDRPLPPPASDLRMDGTTHVVTRAGRRVELTPREFAVLECLNRHAGEVVPRTKLLDEVWGDDYDGSTNVADVYVGYLRRKLERPFRRPLIRTVRGVGFLLH